MKVVKYKSLIDAVLCKGVLSNGYDNIQELSYYIINTWNVDELIDYFDEIINIKTIEIDEILGEEDEED